jgi:hypothetical protein
VELPKEPLLSSRPLSKQLTLLEDWKAIDSTGGDGAPPRRKVDIERTVSARMGTTGEKCETAGQPWWEGNDGDLLGILCDGIAARDAANLFGVSDYSSRK